MELTEILSNGDISTIKVSETIVYGQADTPEGEGLFLRVGAGGQTVGYRAPDQDVTWTDTDNTSVALLVVETQVLSITPNLDVLPSDGSFQVSGLLDNTQNKTRVVTISVKINGTETGTATVPMDKNETGRLFIFSGPLETTVSAGDTVTVDFSADNTGVNLRGDLTESKVILTKGQAAPVSVNSMAVQSLDMIPIATTNRKPSRAEIEDAITAQGITLPLQRSGEAIFGNAHRAWLVKYIHSRNSFVYELLTEAT